MFELEFVVWNWQISVCSCTRDFSERLRQQLFKFPSAVHAFHQEKWLQANTHSLFQQRSDEGTQFFCRERKEKRRKNGMTIQRPGALAIRPALHNGGLSSQFTGKCVIAVQSTVSYNLNHTTAEPRTGFCVIARASLWVCIELNFITRKQRETQNRLVLKRTANKSR